MNNEGSILASSADNDREARVYAAISANIWSTYNKNCSRPGFLGENGEEGLQMVIAECEVSSVYEFYFILLIDQKREKHGAFFILTFPFSNPFTRRAPSRSQLLAPCSYVSSRLKMSDWASLRLRYGRFRFIISPCYIVLITTLTCNHPIDKTQVDALKRHLEEPLQRIVAYTQA